MKIDFGKKMKNLDGEAIKEKDSKGEDKELTLSAVCVNSLMGVTQGDNPPGTEKLRRYELAMRLREPKEIELTVEEIAMLKERVGQFYVTIVVGQAYHMLEGKDEVQTGEKHA